MYTIEYSPYNDDYSAEQLAFGIGSKMIFTFKNGNSKKEYYAPDGTLLTTRYTDLKAKKSYAEYTYMDTVLWFDITDNDTRLSFEIANDTLIEGYQCTKLITTSRTSSLGDTSDFSSVWYYADTLAVNPDWFDDYLEANFNEIMDALPLLPLEFVVSGFSWDRHTKFTKVVRRKVKMKEVRFKPDNNRPLKKI